jgi:ABC-type transport system involved in cytochrome c biogenesis ATPase subunit
MTLLGGVDRMIDIDANMSMSWAPPLSFAINVARLSRDQIDGKFFTSAFVGLVLVGTLIGMTGIAIHWIRANFNKKMFTEFMGRFLPKLFPRYGYSLVEETDEEAADCDSMVMAEMLRVQKSKGTSRPFAVKIQNLVKKFGPTRVIDGLYLGLDFGECFGLLGPNGAGKTTTINMLTGAMEASSGQIQICGVPIVPNTSGISKLISVCPQHDVVWPDLTVEEHLVLFARIKGASNIQERVWVQRVAELVGLDGDSFRSRAGALSGGMQRRLSVAMAVLGGKLDDGECVITGN